MTATTDGRPPTREIDYEDVDDIIGIASEFEHIDAERLSVEELTAVARDLEIPERYVAPAIDELRRRRRARLEAEAKAEARRDRLIRVALVAGGIVAVVFAAWAGFGHASLASARTEIDQLRAQVVNVVERQQATEAQWADAPRSDERAAERSGAENRVRIERRRYDQAAAAYNGQVAAFPASLWAALFGHPTAVPLSNEIHAW